MTGTQLAYCRTISIIGYNIFQGSVIMHKYLLIPAFLFLTACGSLDAGIARWSSDGGCIICLSSSSDASEVAKHITGLQAEERELQQALSAEKSKAEAAQVRLDAVRVQQEILPAFNFQQTRMNAALEDGRLDDITSAVAVGLAESGTDASNAMVEAGRAGNSAVEKTEREKVVGATALLRAELDRLQIL